LFLDELPEFNRKALEALRQPLEDNLICVSRIKRTLIFPLVSFWRQRLILARVEIILSPQKTCHCRPDKNQKLLRKNFRPFVRQD